MISEENKLKFITGKLILLPSGTIIHAKYECSQDREFGSLLKFNKSFNDKSWITIYFGSDYELFIASYYNFKIKFSRKYFEDAFNKLGESNRNEVLEYCDWIISQNYKDYIKRIGALKVFV